MDIFIVNVIERQNVIKSNFKSIFNLFCFQGYVWFLPTWFKHDWYDIDSLNLKGADAAQQNDPMSDMPNCTTAQMIEVGYIFASF